MQPARFRQADFSLVKINNAKSMSPPVSSGEERGLLSRTAAGNRAYLASELLKNSSFSSPITIENIVIFLIMSKNRVNFS